MSLSKYDRICRYEWELTAVARTAITRMLMPFSRMLRKSDRDPWRVKREACEKGAMTSRPVNFRRDKNRLPAGF